MVCRRAGSAEQHRRKRSLEKRILPQRAKGIGLRAGPSTVIGSERQSGGRPSLETAFNLGKTLLFS